ncbi:uncharacterized protein acin1a isoform X2 [Genypterus blacodes]|uniref:uncharacterized protein acin1a isoform X2 n=1 Tax=Genypterus blacodes TaxID=154954 RepID=UPI003F76939B
MADLEDVTLDGRPLQSLRVADLKAALEERGLSKSGHKNALIKRLKGALMLENLQRTSTAHIGLQPNSQIGEEMSQNSFIKQYLAKQQELLRQRLEREAREAFETDDQEDHAEVNNSTSHPAPAQEVAPVSAEQHKPPGPSDGAGLSGSVNQAEGKRNQEANVSSPPSASSAPASAGGEHGPDDSDEDDSEDGEDDGEDDDWDSNARRRNLREPARRPAARERSAASHQPQQQHVPSLLSPQLRQPTPPPSPIPELSFPLPDTPKQSPPSPDVAPARHRSPSSSSSGSSSSDSRSSSPEPQRSGHAERKPGPLTLLARKMESEGAFSGAGWHGGAGEAHRQDNSSPSATFPGRGPPEGSVSAITHTANTAGRLPFSVIPGTNQGVMGAHASHIQAPVSVLRATATEERDSEVETENALELERNEKQRKLEEEQERALALEREERQRALEREQALAREEKEKALQQERELALERERVEREQALAKEREQALARERALQLEMEKELERQRAREQERALQRAREEMEMALQREREEKERAMALERAKALEREQQERERALEQERERALDAERKERERIEREKALELEREQAEREHRERLERVRMEMEKALEQARIERERALEQERLEKERVEREKALEQERLEREKALERERLEMEQERIKREKALEQERIERERVLQQDKERADREATAELERQERERAERERKEKEQERLEKAKEQERLEKERALEVERKRVLKEERERALEEERKRALEREKLEMEKAAEEEKEEQERALEQEKQRARLAEKERESHLPPSKRGREIGLTSLPTSIPPSAGPIRKSATEEAEPEGGETNVPVIRRDAQAAETGEPMSPSIQGTPLSPQSSFKKFRFFRDSPIQSQSSSTSMVIKRPRTFSDSPQPQASPVTLATNVGEREPEVHQPAAAQQIRAKQEVPSPQKEKDPSQVSDFKAEAASAETQHHTVKESPHKAKEVDKGKPPLSPLGAAKQKDEDARKEGKRSRQKSSSNDSSSSDSDSGSSSSRSSSSSTSSEEKARRREGKPARDPSPQHRVAVEAQVGVLKESPKASKMMSVEKSNTADEGCHTKQFPGASAGEETKRTRENSDGEEEKDKHRQVKDTAMSEPEKLPETSEETPKAFSARKISLSSSKVSPGTVGSEGDQDSGGAAGRKRRWGSSTAVTAKKPSFSITTDSLKSLMPDMRPSLGQEAVVDLHPEEAALSGAEDEDRSRPDQDLQIRRTVTQVVHAEGQENGQKEAKRSRREDLEEDDLRGERERIQAPEEKTDSSFADAMESQSPSHSSPDIEISSVTASDTLIRRSISQQKTGVSVTIDDPVRTARQPSPPRGKISNIVHISNLVRPFTLGQLKELLGRTGALVDDGFWIDKIKSHCYVTYSSLEEAAATREALHGVKWPQSNPKVLSVEFCQQDDLDFHKGLGAADKPGAEDQVPGPGRGRTLGLASLLPERDQWAEREREMERREKARAEREWDRDKVKEFGKPGEEKEGGARRSRSRERRRKERGKSKEKKTEKKEKAAEDPPAKLLDDLFRKTKAAPCIYWLPLTEEQYVQREAARAERIKLREKLRKEEEEKKREEERKERMKPGGGPTVDRASEGEKDKDKDRNRERDRDRVRERERERDRDRENDKRRDGYRRPGGSGTGGGRRSRSRSDPRERRR